MGFGDPPHSDAIWPRGPGFCLCQVCRSKGRLISSFQEQEGPSKPVLLTSLLSHRLWFSKQDPCLFIMASLCVVYLFTQIVSSRSVAPVDPHTFRG
eukprot:bmy_00865T0